MDVDVGRNIGAHLQIDQAEADKKIARRFFCSTPLRDFQDLPTAERKPKGMKARLLPYLACPDSRGDIEGDFVEELEEGELVCAGCQRIFPVKAGVPRSKS